MLFYFIVSPSSVKSGIVQEGEVTVLGFGCDVASEEAVQSTMSQVQRKLGMVDTLVTAAGALLGLPLIEVLNAFVQALLRTFQQPSEYSE